MRRATTTALLLLCLACGGHAKTALQGDDVVLATVEGGVPVTEYELTRAAQATLGNLGKVALSRATRRELVEGMALGRAVALLRERELDDAGRAELDKRVAAFRERILVEQYLQQHGGRSSASEADLRAYYEANPGKFGARKTRSFELVTAPIPAQDAQRVQVLATLGRVRDASDWPSAVADASRQLAGLTFTRGDAQLGNLHPTLRATAQSLGVGEASSVLALDGKVYLLRITAIDTTEPRPFSEVREQIAAVLAPRSDKRAILAVRDEVLKKVKVSYASSSAGSQE